MDTLTLQLTPLDYTALIGYMLRNSAKSELMPLETQLVEAILYREYLRRNATWSQRWGNRTNKKYAVKLPMAVALTLWRRMPHRELTYYEQGVLNILDYAIVNYRNPYQNPTQIGQLISQYQ